VRDDDSMLPEILRIKPTVLPADKQNTCQKCGDIYLGYCRNGLCHPCALAAAQIAERSRIIDDTARSIPTRFQWASFDNPVLLLERVHPKSAVEDARGHVGSVTIVIAGGSGSGKTSLACAILRKASANCNESGVFVTAFDLAVARQQHPLGENEAPALERAFGAPIVLLDEIGSEYARYTATQEVIHRRHNWALPTIYTTGFSAAELVQRYGDGIVRRMFEGSSVIRLGGTT